MATIVGLLGILETVGPIRCVQKLAYTWGEVTSRSLWSRYDRHFVGITQHNALS